MPKILLLVLVLTQVISLNHTRPQLTAEQFLKIQRLEIVRAVHLVEDAHENGVISEAEYTKSKGLVMDAVRYYNYVQERFKRYGVIAGDERQRLVALLAAVTMAVTHKGGEK